MSQSTGSPHFGYDDHFTPARTRKKRKNRPTTESPSPSVLLNKTSEELTPTDWMRDTIQMLRESLEEAFPSSDLTPDVLCLGLGSPSSSRDARAQLALLLAASDDLHIERTKLSVFDPVFAQQDLQLLAQCALTLLPANCEARHELDSPTIVYMPHCDLHLYENLFRENWSAQRLPNILLIANRLNEYAERCVQPAARPSPRDSIRPRPLPIVLPPPPTSFGLPPHLLTIASVANLVSPRASSANSISSRKLAAEHPCVARLGTHHLSAVTHRRSPSHVLARTHVRAFPRFTLLATHGAPALRHSSHPGLAPRFPFPCRLARTPSVRPRLARTPTRRLSVRPLPVPQSATALGRMDARACAVPYLTSRPFESCAPYPTAFNNTAIQFLRPSALAERGPEWWALPSDSQSIIPRGLHDDATASLSVSGAVAPGAPAPSSSQTNAAPPLSDSRDARAASGGSICADTNSS